MISAYRAKLYRLIFTLAAIYNIAFGLWACLWPRAFFTSLEMAPPNYPGLWQCLGMVVGLYGVLYASAAWSLHRAKLIIAVGLAGKILGPIGLCLTIHSGEWPLRTFSLVVFNDLIWWLPFTLFLLEGTRFGEHLRAAAPWACAVANMAAALVMWLVLRAGTEAASGIEARATYIASHPVAWRIGWGIWMLAGLSLVAFYTWWGAWLPSPRRAIAALLVAIAGLDLRSLRRIAFHRLAALPNRCDRSARVAPDRRGGQRLLYRCGRDAHPRLTLLARTASRLGLGHLGQRPRPNDRNVRRQRVRHGDCDRRVDDVALSVGCGVWLEPDA